MARVERLYGGGYNRPLGNHRRPQGRRRHRPQGFLLIFARAGRLTRRGGSIHDRVDRTAARQGRRVGWRSCALRWRGQSLAVRNGPVATRPDPPQGALIRPENATFPNARLGNGAVKRTRTSTPVKELAPQASASTNSAMTARNPAPRRRGAEARRLAKRFGRDKREQRRRRARMKRAAEAATQWERRAFAGEGVPR